MEELEEDFYMEDNEEMESFDDDTDFGLLIESDIADICNTYVKFSDLNINSLLPFESRPIVSLTQEEREVINKCTDNNLTRLLILNRAHSSQVRELMKQFQYILLQCNKCIAKGKESVADLKLARQITTNNIIRSDLWKTAAPYFKDAQFFGAPPNADVIKKQKNGELCLLKVSEGRRWTNIDRRTLLNSVKLHFYKYRTNELKRKISALKNQALNLSGNKKKKMHFEINQLDKEIHDLQLVVPPVNTVVGIDWLSISCVDLKGRHPIIECMAYWNMLLHPSINKREWDEEEEEKLKKLVKKNDYQDWDTIAKQLDSNRSPFIAAKHFLSHFATKFNRERFTPEEDEYIMEVVENVRLGSYIPWGKVAYYFDNRSKYQIYHRYKYYLSYNNIKKGQFTEAEDVMLIFLVKRLGKNFTEIAKHIPNRTPVQLRNRFGNYLDQTIVHVGCYSFDDDAKILEHVKKFGDKNWGKIARSLNRTRSHVRQRYLTLKKWLVKNPNLKMTDMPRRNRPYIAKNYCGRTQRITTVLQQLNNVDNIPDIEVIENLLVIKNVKQGSPEPLHYRNNEIKRHFSGVDKDLVDFFKGTCKFQRELSRYDEDMQLQSAHRIIQLMELFDENIDSLRYAEEDDKFINLRMLDILTYIKNILQTETPCTAKASILPSSPIKNFLPPTIRTLLGFRGLIIKFNMYKNEYKLKDDSKTKVSNLLAWKLEQSLLKYNSPSRAVLEYERNLFFKRLYAVFKWPIIISNQYPTHISITGSSITCNSNKKKSTEDKTEAENSIRDDNPAESECIKTNDGKRKKTSSKVGYKNAPPLSKKPKLSEKPENATTNFNNNAGGECTEKVISLSDIKLPISKMIAIDQKTFDSLIMKNKDTHKFVVLGSPIVNNESHRSAASSSPVKVKDEITSNEYFNDGETVFTEATTKK